MFFFAVKGSLYYLLVKLVMKLITTVLAVGDPGVLNGWYDFNNYLIANIPVYGQQLRALIRDNVADGVVAFWEVWFLLALFVSVVRLTAEPGARHVKTGR